VQELIPDVDDTDGLDPAAEFEEWRLRELGRVKRDKEAQVRREEEREEIERRRALPEAQRLAEDLAHAQKSRDEKPQGQQKFLQKYYHKGAYHQVRVPNLLLVIRGECFTLWAGLGHPQETRLYRGHNIYCGHVAFASSHAGQELWQEKPYEIHTSPGSRHDPKHWRFWGG
jgi:Microfibril-associated/Pre-mRNA processing